MRPRIIRLLTTSIALCAATSVMAHGGHVPANDPASHGLLHAIAGWEGILALLAAGIGAGALVYGLRRAKRPGRERAKR